MSPTNQNSVVVLSKIRLALMGIALLVSVALPSIGAYVSLNSRITRNETNIEVLYRLESKIDQLADAVRKLELSVQRLEVKVDALEARAGF